MGLDMIEADMVRNPFPGLYRFALDKSNVSVHIVTIHSYC